MGDKPGMDLLVKVRNFLDGRSTLPRLILIIGFESGLKINFHWVGGWLDQMGIRLTSASTGVGVEVGAELCNNKIRKVRQANLTGRVFNYTLSP